METRCYWSYTHPAWGRALTKEPFTEAEALCIFPDAERVEGSQVVAEDAGHVGWGFASGLIRRDDRAMVQDDGQLLERPGS